MSVTPALCPVCGTASQPQDIACAMCGLIFSSYAPLGAAPPTLPPLTCPQCAQLTASGSTCTACGATLTYQYQALSPSQTLAQGRYTVQRALSKGGMGAIYLATDHEAFDRTVVIKAMLDYFDPHDPHAVQAARERFLHEAKTLATLRHPAIPQIYTYFQDSTYNYIVMEYIEGHDLEQRLTHQDDASGRLRHGQNYPQAEVLRWGMALCRVLEYLAERKPHPVVHHDIKPANLLLDSDSGEIRLVDFGTAKARLLAGAGGMGLQKSSIHGTAGYAAPEQYRGESEPRSDIYALAATLYHLTTDDDPRGHPFDFPQLPQLGAFGQVLRAALNPDAAQRSSAAAVYRQLEALSVLHSGRPLEAPDGSELTDIAALVSWCEQHWPAATTWLYGKLPDQLELWWGQTRLAHDLRAITAQHAKNQSLGLDTALAQIDPQGFGRTHARLICSTPVLRYQKMTPRSIEDQELIIENVGRRHAALAIQKPRWVSAASWATIDLPPGEQKRFNVTAYGNQLTVGGQVRDSIFFRDGSLTLLEVEVQTFISRWWRLLMIGRTTLRYLPRTIAIVGALFALTMCCGGGQLVKQSFQNNANGQKYEAGVAAMERGDWAAALQEFDQIKQTYNDIDQRRQEVHYQLGVVALQREDWYEARLAFQRAGQYRDAPTLLEASYTDERERSGLLIEQFAVPAEDITNAIVLLNGKYFFSVHNETLIKLWRTEDRTLIQTFDGHPTGVTTAALSPDGKTFASAAKNGVIKIWRTSDGALLKYIDVHTNLLQLLMFSPDGQYLASQSKEAVNVWKLPDYIITNHIAITDSEEVRIAFTSDNDVLTTTRKEQIVYLENISKQIQIMRIELPIYGYRSLTIGSDGKIIAISNEHTHNVSVFQGQENILHQLTPLADAEGFLIFSPDGDIIAAGEDRNQVVRLWSTQSGKMLARIPIYNGTISSIAFAADGRTLYSSHDDGTIMVWQIPQL